MNSSSLYASRNREAYGRNVATYARSYESEKNKTLDLWPLLRRLKRGASILDAGCAFGRTTRVIFNYGGLKNLNFNVTGVDFTPENIEFAKRYYGVPKHSRINDENMHEYSPVYQVADFRTLSTTLQPRSFDAIFCRAAFDHLALEDMPLALSNFNTVLKPNGVLVLITRQGSGRKSLVEHTVNFAERLITGLQPDGLQNMLTEANFRVVANKGEIVIRPSKRLGMAFLTAVCRTNPS